MAKKSWHEEHPGGGGAKIKVTKQPRITVAEKQQAANNPNLKPLTVAEAKNHPGGA